MTKGATVLAKCFCRDLPAGLDPASRSPDGLAASPPINRLKPPRRHRTIFISDIHLGTRACKAALLTDFLQCNIGETLYIVGDLIDGWRLKRRWFWAPEQTNLVRTLLALAEAGTRVVYVPGNHDEFLRPFCGRRFAGIEIAHEAVHIDAAGRRFLVLHGDAFDDIVTCAPWLARIGDALYELVLKLNDGLFRMRTALGLPYWSLSACLKGRVKQAVAYVSRFEEAVAATAATWNVDGVICGHIHHAQKREIGEIIYLNDGDWVESCTALVEDALGNMEILHWTPYDTARDFAGAGNEPAEEAALIPV